MIRRQPRPTRTDTLVPSTTLSRSPYLGPRLTMGPGEMKSGGHRRDSVLADTVEAIIAAVYLDAGFSACREVVLRWLEPDIAALPVGKVKKEDRKSTRLNSSH